MAEVTLPVVGDEIYLPTSIYLSHGADDFMGGKATVNLVEMGKSAGQQVPFIRCKERPSTRYNWEILAEEQDELRKRFGDERAHPDPDDREEFNRWD